MEYRLVGLLCWIGRKRRILLRKQKNSLQFSAVPLRTQGRWWTAWRRGQQGPCLKQQLNLWWASKFIVDNRKKKRLQQLKFFAQPWLYNPYTPFGPVVEKKSPAPFIDRSPIEIITSGDVNDVPWITTVVSEEGLYPAAGDYYTFTYLHC